MSGGMGVVGRGEKAQFKCVRLINLGRRKFRDGKKEKEKRVGDD